jgi:hypothetical protein
VIDVRAAAVALACASPTLAHAVVAKREVSRLFSDNSIYRALFNAGTDPLRLSRSVAITRRVDHLLDETERKADGVEAGVAVHGRRVIAHLIMRELGDVVLKDPDADLDAKLSNLPSEVAGYVAALVTEFPANAYPGNVFKNQARVVQLLQDAGLKA